jgi:hypothetical protein
VKNREKFVIRKVERIENAAVIWIFNRRFAMYSNHKAARGAVAAVTSGQRRILSL